MSILIHELYYTSTSISGIITEDCKLNTDTHQSPRIFYIGAEEFDFCSQDFAISTVTPCTLDLALVVPWAVLNAIKKQPTRNTKQSEESQTCSKVIYLIGSNLTPMFISTTAIRRFEL
jgi:hypothetical protein